MTDYTLHAAGLRPGVTANSYLLGADTIAYAVSLKAATLTYSAGGSLADYRAASNPNDAQYASYTKLFGEHFNDYADTTALLAAVPFSTDSVVPVSSMVRLMTDDPIHPAVAEMTSPYNDAWTTASGSAGKQPHLHHTFASLQTRVIYRFARRFGGTAHPVHPSSSDYTVAGTYPGGGTDCKVAFILWESGSPYNGGRIELLHPGATELVGVGFGTGTNHPVATETGFVEPGVTDGWPSGSGNVAAQLTGAEWYEYTIDAYRVNDDLYVVRYFRQQITSGGSYNPQPIQMKAFKYVRTGGTIFPKMRVAQYYINKNKTSRDDGLSSTTFDNPDVFSALSTTTGTPRGEGSKPFKGIRHYCGVKMGFTGGDFRPFTDHLGTNIDDLGRGSPSWPAGA